MNELLSESKQKYSHDDSVDLELHWRIFYFVPNLIISILFAYGVQYQAVVDIMVVSIYSKDKENFNNGILIVCSIFIVIQKAFMIYTTFYFF